MWVSLRVRGWVRKGWGEKRKGEEEGGGVHYSELQALEADD